jgi:flagella basal body P-ring formation protein FlgA
LYAKADIILKEHYCIKNNTLNIKDIYPRYKQDITLMHLTNALSSFKVPSLEIISKLKPYISVPIIDKSGGIIMLDKQCDIKYQKNIILKELKKVFKAVYNDIKVIKLDVKPINSFPQNFSDFSFDKIIINHNNIRKKSGNFTVVYKSMGKKTVRIFFKYKIDAKISLFKAKHNIPNGKILSQNDYEKVMTDFNRIPLNFVKNLKSGAFIARNYIRKGSVITGYMIRRVTLVRKKDLLRSVIKDGRLELEFFTRALQNGDKGDIIKTIGNNGKIYKAKIIERGLVEIQ